VLGNDEKRKNNAENEYGSEKLNRKICRSN
jgi:hypothetical protein